MIPSVADDRPINFPADMPGNRSWNPSGCENIGSVFPTETPTETPAEAGREPSEIPRDEKISEAFSGAISDQNAKDEETIDPAPPPTHVFGHFWAI